MADSQSSIHGDPWTFEIDRSD